MHSTTANKRILCLVLEGNFNPVAQPKWEIKVDIKADSEVPSLGLQPLT